ncbi:MAG: hypothetical protein HYX51_07025, partial [Chloroflexi bacterium]|nr:hypothetical protein [Chloroflexota bacterium]
MSLTVVATVTVTGVTLLGVLVRPRQLSEGTIAGCGALCAVTLGLLPMTVAVDAIVEQAGVLAFFVSLLLIAWTVEASGFFEWAALIAARSAGGRADRLLLNVFVTGVVITALLSNDATALLLTPMVFVLVRRLQLPALPFVLACTFIADTASTLLPFSNPLNLIILARFPATLPEFLTRMLVPALTVTGINIGLFFILFRHLRGRRFNPDDLPLPASVLPDLRYFHITVVALVALGAGYAAASAYGWPVAAPGLAVASALLLVGTHRGRLRIAGVRTISWTILPFVAGMFVLVQALTTAGVTDAAGARLVDAGDSNVLRTSVVLTFGSALGANVVNNLPMTSFMVEAISRADGLTGAAREAAVWGTLIGSAVGPNLTLVGSLATMLWLVLLRDRGLEVRAWDYMRVGLVVTPPMLLSA